MPEHQSTVRRIVHDLEVHTYSSHAEKNVGFLLEAAPDLLDRILARCNASSEERDMWRDLLRKTTLPAVGESFHKYLLMITQFLEAGRLAVSIRSMTARNQSSVQELRIIICNEGVRRICKTDESDMPLLKSAILMMAIAQEIDDVAGTDNEGLQRSAEYARSHLMEIEALLPELVRRRAITVDEIRTIVEGAPVPLAAGIL